VLNLETVPNQNHATHKLASVDGSHGQFGHLVQLIAEAEEDSDQENVPMITVLVMVLNMKTVTLSHV